MSSTSTNLSLSPSLFGKLPVELLKRIVEDVHEQDKVFHKSNLTGAAERDGEPEDPREGVWSAWFGRGLLAMSVLDKRTRTLCFPVMCRSVTLKQVASPIFRFDLVRRQDVLSSIEHLDLREGLGERLYTNAATILPHLSPTSLSLDRPLVSLVRSKFLVGASHPSEAPYVAQVFAQSITRATTFAFHNIDVFGVGDALQLLPHTSRHLEIVYSADFRSRTAFDFQDDDAEGGRRFSTLLRNLSALESLSITFEGVLNSFTDDWTPAPAFTNGLSLPSLRTISLPAGAAADAITSFASSLAPNLHSLRLGILNCDSLALPPSPSLRHLHISLHSHISSFDLSFPPSSSLASLTIESDALYPIKCANRLPSVSKLPSSLRLITLRHPTVSLPPDREAYRAACAERGIVFRLEWSPDLGAVEEMLEGHDADRPLDPDEEELLVEGGRETLDWARRRLDWAAQVGDHRMVLEIVQAAYRLRERQAIEMQ